MDHHQPYGGNSFKVNKAIASFWGSRPLAVAAAAMVNDEYTKNETRPGFHPPLVRNG